MKKFLHPLKIICISVVMLITTVAHGKEFPKLILELDEIIIGIDEMYQLPAEAGYQEKSEGKIEQVSVKWKADPGYLGKIDRYGVFTALHPGEGLLVAKYKSAECRVKIIITGDSNRPKDDEDEYPKIKIIPSNIRVESADSVELRAFYIDETGEKTDTFFNWSVSNAELGEFPHDTTSMFHAGIPGTGYIKATLGELSDRVKVTVLVQKNKHENEKSKRLTIVPGDTIIHFETDLTIQYNAVLKNIKLTDQSIFWSVSDESVATIDPASGLLTLAGETGLVLVKAAYGKVTAMVELLVVNPEIDLNVNKITIQRVLPDGHELPPKVFREGETYKIGGLPYPLSILNAGMLHFPFGCIHENIKIYMFIPEEYAELDDENAEVNFTEQVISGVKFNVLPEGSDEIVEPYYFDMPVILSLVFKHGILDSMQILPENLDVFFAENTGFIKVEEKVEVDTVRNKIYSQIEHFSTIVIREKNINTTAEKIDAIQNEKLNIYPNPFYSATKIKYSLTKETQVNLVVHNMFGQPVKVLVKDTQSEGIHTITWDGTNESGSRVPNGIYICRMLKDGKLYQVSRMVLSR